MKHKTIILSAVIVASVASLAVMLFIQRIENHKSHSAMLTDARDVVTAMRAIQEDRRLSANSSEVIDSTSVFKRAKLHVGVECRTKGSNIYTSSVENMGVFEKGGYFYLRSASFSKSMSGKQDSIGDDSAIRFECDNGWPTY